jgi:2-polyprenyl-3-methyl-5-hydroxy-6-metoxy-1,4-benzoquinol methylase
MLSEARKTSDLFDWRRQAAYASGGTSEDYIYSLILSVVSELNLGGRILDYGAGVGNLVRRLVDLKIFDEVHAADIMAMPEDLHGVVWSQQDLNTPLMGYDDYFDVIVSAEVIEHLENPRAMVRDLYRICKPGGHLLVTTPNNESIRALCALLVRGHFVLFGDSNYPAHISALLRKDLTRIFEEAGFEQPSFRFTAKGAVPGLTCLAWQRLSLGLLRGVRFSDGVLAFARKPG